jgi:hypothetical protein
MTFEEIVAEIADRLNLTSDTAITRIGRSVNERYKWLCTSMGLQTTSQGVVSATTTVGSDLLTFGPIPYKVSRLESVFNPAYPRPNTLNQVSLVILRNMTAGTDPAQNYAIYETFADRWTIKLDSQASSPYELQADALISKPTLSGADVPKFPEAYHDTLVYGGMATELDKMEKPDLAQVQEARWADRNSELRLFIAKSGYMDIYQGRTAPGTLVVNRLV